jgi:epoxyqueuosine reductase
MHDLPDTVANDGRIARTECVKAQAAALGFDAVRVTTAEAAPRADVVRAWLDAGLQGNMAFLDRRHKLRSGSLNNRRLLDGTRSVVMLGVSYYAGGRESPPGDRMSPRGTVARYARGVDYHGILRDKLNRFRDWLEAAWPGERARGYTDSGPIRERELAARAGMGWIGKHTGLISLDLGNWFFLAGLLTTLEMEPDNPEGDRCGTCTRCLSACPTGALIGPYAMDARRCISYLTIEIHGSIPLEMRTAVGDRIFGCDDCLAACPWNDRARAGNDVRLAVGDWEAGHPDLLEWLDLLASESAFNDRFAGTALLRPGRDGLRRNVCVALGNVGGPESLGPLVAALRSDASSIVRGHAAWAIGEIASRTDTPRGGAADALRDARVVENDALVLSEIDQALDRGKRRAARELAAADNR